MSSQGFELAFKRNITLIGKYIYVSWHLKSIYIIEFDKNKFSCFDKLIKLHKSYYSLHFMTNTVIQVPNKTQDIYLINQQLNALSN